MLERLEAVIEECRKIEDADLVDSPEEIVSGEKVIGEMSFIQKRMFTWMMNNTKGMKLRALGCLIDAHENRDNPDLPEVAKAGSLHNLIHCLLYDNIRMDYDLWNCTVSIKKGFQIVTSPVEAPPQMMGFGFPFPL